MNRDSRSIGGDASSRHQTADATYASGRKRKASSEALPRNRRQSATKERLTEANLSKHQDILCCGLQEGHVNAMESESISSTSTAIMVASQDKEFKSRLAENGVVYAECDVEAPEDAEALKVELLKARKIPPSASTSWEQMCEAKSSMVLNDLTLTSMIVESMLLRHRLPCYYLRFRYDPWSKIDNKLTAGLSCPQPAVTEAYTWSAYPEDTRNDSDELHVTEFGFCMPTFAIESEWPGCDHERAVRHAARDGAIMTHATLAIDEHVGKDLRSQYGKTKAITVALTDAELGFYANHAIIKESSKRRSKFSQHKG